MQRSFCCEWLTDGSYAVIVSQNGCTDTFACFTVNKCFKDGAKIYPNPTTGNLTINLGGTCSDVTLKVYNTLGQMVEVYQFADSEEVKVDLRGVTGVYTVRIQTEEGYSTTFKVIKG